MVDASVVLAGTPDAAESDSSDAGPDVFDLVLQALQATAIRNAVGRLPSRERAVIVLRYGLDGAPMGWREICAAVKCSNATARRTERLALERLRTKELQELVA